MDRRGVAATIVSFVVFTSLVLANSVLYSTADSSLDATLLSAVQVDERTTAVVLEGTSAFGALSSVQAYLQSNPLDCSSPLPYLDGLAGSAAAEGSDGGVSYETRTTWTYSSNPLSGEDPEALSPFGGGSPGDLNLTVSVSVEESYEGGLPTYSTGAVESAHLPVGLSSAISLCQSALSYLAESLSSLQSCNSTGVEEALSSADSLYPALDSFSLAASAAQTQNGCFVTYSVMTALAETGVLGQFQWSVGGEGSLETSVQPVSPPSGA